MAAIASVAFGALLALIPRFGPRAVGYVRTFALIAAITVVGGDLLPEAIDGLGLVAIAVVLAGVFLPGWIERALESRIRIGLELGFAALVLHHVADGLAIALYSELSVVIALVAHTIPVIAVVVLRFATERGRNHALIRAALLGVAIILGAVLGRVVPHEAIEPAHPWLGAAVAGLLLHVITHDLTSDPPESHGGRALDFLACLIGIGLPLFASDVEPELGERFLALALDFAPPLLVAVVAAALIRPRTRTSEGGIFAAFTAARRFLGIDALIAAFVFLGGAHTLLYAGCAAAIAGAFAIVFRGGEPRETVELQGPGTMIAWAILGTLFAAMIGFERTSFSSTDIFGAAAALAVLTAAPIAARMPLVAVLMYAGFPPLVAFAALLIDRTAVREISERASMPRRAAAIAVVLAIAALGGYAASLLESPSMALRAPPAIAGVCLALLGVILAWNVYRAGARRYLGALGGAHEHAHAPTSDSGT